MGQNSLGEIHGWEKVWPVVLEVVDEGVEVLVNVLIEDFRVAVSLWVVGGWKLLFDTCKLAELVRKGGDKLRSLVWRDGLWGAVDSPRVLIVKPGCRGCCCFASAWEGKGSFT